MLFRFSLYGFLKNQRYFEPFLLLAFQEKGLSYYQIGLLISLRGVLINFLEIPSGVMADAWGKRRAMMLSFTAYCAAFLLFGDGCGMAVLALGMALFSVGEAFRSGTHKALIFDWLQATGQLAERERIYGITRSWAKVGSAVSGGIAAVLVFLSGHYADAFYFCLFPYFLGLVNFLFYPADPKVGTAGDGVIKRLRAGFAERLREVWQRPRLRPLLAESALFEGPYKVVKDYIQPLLQTLALGIPLLNGYATAQRGAVLIGLVFAGLSLMEAVAARQAFGFTSRSGGRCRGGRLLWAGNILVYAGLTVLAFFGFPLLAVGCFLLLAILQNLWRPLMVGRLGEASGAGTRATTLSVNSQLNALLAVVLAPVIGWFVDHSQTIWAAGIWPGVLSVLGLVLALRFCRESKSMA